MFLDMYNSGGTGPSAAGSGNWTNSWGPLTNSGSAGSSEYCRSNFSFFYLTHSFSSTPYSLSITTLNN